MPHLSPAELLDVAEGAAEEASSMHLGVCVTCRQQVADLRSMMGAAASMEIPEPSPLFWNHLSARIRERVAAEDPVPNRWHVGWQSWRLVAALGVAVVVVGVGMRLAMPPVADRNMPESMQSV